MDPATELRPNRFGVGAATVLLVAAAAALALGLLNPASYLLVALGLASPFALVAGAAGLRRALRQRTAGDPVHVTAEGVRVRGEFHPLSSFAHAEVAVRAGLTELTLARRHGPPLSIAFDNEARARHALLLLGLEEKLPVLSTDARTSLRDDAFVAQAVGWTLGVIAFVAVRFFWDDVRELSPRTALVLLSSVVTLGAPLFWSLRSRVTIAHDGVEIRTGLRRRFLPRDEIVSVERSANEGSGELLVKTSDNQITGITFDDPERYRRHLLALVATRSRGGAAELEPLARGQRTLTEWVGQLRGLADQTTFRGVGVPVERLWEVVSDARASLTARAAAAVALAGKPEKEHRQRLARIASDSAAPRLRVVVEAATREDDEAVGAALAELEAEEQQWVRPRRGD